MCESAIFTESRRDIFPLAPIVVEAAPGAHLSRGVKQRVSRRRGPGIRSNLCISSLNSIYGSSLDRSSHCISSNSLSCSERIHQRMKEYVPSRECSAEEAIRALLGSEISYDGESRPDTTVAPFDMSRVALPSLLTAPTSALDMLDCEGARIVKGFETELLLSREDYLARLEFEGVQAPYCDPKLKNDLHSYRAFITELFHQNIVSFSETILCECGLFFVHKEDKTLRMIIHCRPCNQCFKKCAHPPMGGASAWSSINLGSSQTLHTSMFDVQAYFYRIGIPVELARFFGLPAVSTAFVASLGFDTSSVKSAFMHPIVQVVPMGFSWAMWIAQRVHLHISLEATGLSPSRIVMDGRPAPVFSCDDESTSVALMPYADNGNVLALAPELVDKYTSLSIAKLRSYGFGVHESMDASVAVVSLGVEVLGDVGIVRPSGKRLSRALLALDAVLNRPLLCGKQLEKLIGHLTFIMLLHRPFLSLLGACYSFVQSSYLRKQLLWKSVLDELSHIRNLLPLCVSDIKLRLNSRVHAGDSSRVAASGQGGFSVGSAI